jgi:hypothetical protein
MMSSLKPIAAVLVLCGWLAGPRSAAFMGPQLLQPDELRYYEKVRSVVDLTPTELRKAYPDLKKLDPSPSQDDLGLILQKVGERVETFIRDFPNTVSIEDVRRERLSQTGAVQETIDQTFNYLALTRSEGNTPGLTEFRTDNKGRPLAPHAMEGPSLMTSGFVSMSMYFHPRLQPQSDFRYLGHLTFKAHDAYVVGFAQRPKVAQVGTMLEFGNRIGEILVQGIANIDTTSYQILQMRVELLAPRPDLGVNKYSTEIRYGEIHFRKDSTALWIPRDVVVTLDMGGQLFRNFHHYSHFKMFNVDAKEKPAVPEPTPSTSPNPK